MKLIKDDSGHAFQRRVALQASGQNAFGHDLDEGVRSGLVVQLDTVANRFADRLAQRLRHPPGCRPRRQTTRFQDDNPAALAPGRIQKPQRNSRGFPGARCCLITAFGVCSRLAQSSGNMSSIGSLVMVPDRVD
jgi:hypothetical protein